MKDKLVLISHKIWAGIKKNWFFIFLVVLSILTSILTFYFTCIFGVGIFNKDVGLNKLVLIFMPGISGFLLPIELIIFLIGICRLYKRPKAIRRFLRTYSITYICLSSLGLATIITSGILTYGNFLVSSPFSGYHIIMILWHSLVILISILSLSYFRIKIKIDDEDNDKTSFKHKLFTFALSLITFYSLNRFGAFLLSPIYISLLALITLLVQGYLYYFDVYNTTKKRNVGLILTISFITLFTYSFIHTGINGYFNPLLLSAVSPAVPFERMITFPLAYIGNTLTFLIMSSYILYVSIKSKIKDKNILKDVNKNKKDIDKYVLGIKPMKANNINK